MNLKFTNYSCANDKSGLKLYDMKCGPPISQPSKLFDHDHYIVYLAMASLITSKRFLWSSLDIKVITLKLKKLAVDDEKWVFQDKSYFEASDGRTGKLSHRWLQTPISYKIEIGYEQKQLLFKMQSVVKDRGAFIISLNINFNID